MRARQRSRIAAVLAAVALVGCAAVQRQPPISNGAAAVAGAAYVAGTFPRNPGAAFELFFTNMDTGQEVAMRAGKSLLLKDLEYRVTAISLPPGRYMLANWGTSSTRTMIVNPAVSMPFEIGAGQVAYVGHFDAGITASGNLAWGITENYRLHPSPTTAARSREAFDAGYPGLASLAFDCKMCSDLTRPVSTAPLSPPTPASARPGQPEGAIALNPALFDGRLWSLARSGKLPARLWRMFPNGVMDATFQGRSSRGTYRIENDRLCLGDETGTACKVAVLRDGELNLLWLATGDMEPLSIR
jgi:hypothetical protein